MLYNSIIEILLLLLVAVTVVGIIWAGRRFLFNNPHKQEIIEAERLRLAHPDIQNGRFTRLYTMPYTEELTGEYLCHYCQEHLPSYFFKASANMVRISENRAGISGEVRELYITHLREQNITAIELSDPYEVEYTGRYGHPVTRSGINDKGFSQDIRAIIRQFQQEAVSK